MAGADVTGADQRTDQVTGAAFRLTRDREAVPTSPLARRQAVSMERRAGTD